MMPVGWLPGGTAVRARAEYACIAAFCAASLLMLQRAPFPVFHRAAFVFGYYVRHEYSVLTRPYALSLLFLMVAAALYRDHFRKPAASLVVCQVSPPPWGWEEAVTPWVYSNLEVVQ